MAKIKSKIGFQFHALQKRIKLLEAKNLLLTEENRSLKAKARENWRENACNEAAQTLLKKVEKDMFQHASQQYFGLSEQIGNPKPWYRRLFGG